MFNVTSFPLFIPDAEQASSCPPDDVTDCAMTSRRGHLSAESDYDYVIYRDDLHLMNPWETDSAFYPSSVTYGLTFVLGVVGNCLVVGALYFDRKSHNVTSAFMASLAVADLVFLLVCVPFEISFKLMLSWVGGALLCKATGYAEMLSALASVSNMTAVSIERYIVIVHPMKSRALCTMRNTYRTIAGVWAVSILLSSPMIHIMETRRGLYYSNRSHVMVMSCADTRFRDDAERVAFGWYQLLVLFLLPVLIILYCYVRVIRVLWISTQELIELTNSHGMAKSDQSEERLCRQRAPLETLQRQRCGFSCQATRRQSADVKEARKQVIRMLMTIVIVFFVCWGPKLVLTVMKRHYILFLHSDNFFNTLLVINLLPYVHSCVNPVIYYLMSNKFRRSMRVACRCFGCIRQRAPLEADDKRAGRSIYSPGGARHYKSVTFISTVS